MIRAPRGNSLDGGSLTTRKWKRSRAAAAGISCICVLLSAGAEVSSRTATGKGPMTVAAGIETSRLISVDARWGDGDVSSQNIFVSPNGERYAAIIVRGDVARDGVWMDLVSGGLNSLAATSMRRVASFFTRDLGPTPLTFRYDFRFRWLADGARVAFLADEGQGQSQVVVVNVVTGGIYFATAAPRGVQSFDVGANGLVVYTTATSRSKALADEMMQTGFLVTDVDAAGILRGFPGPSGLTNYEYYLVAPTSARVQAIKVAGGTVGRMAPQIVEISPDGTHAIIDGSPPPAAIPVEWREYSDPLMSSYAAEARTPGGGRSWIIQRLYVVDTSSGIAKPLWNAPKPFSVNVVTWSPDGRSVLLGPAFLPPGDPSPAGRAGKAFAVVEVPSGSYQELKIPIESRKALRPISWSTMGVLSLGNGREVLCFRKYGLWRQARCDARSRRTGGRYRIEQREGLNTPPTLVAVNIGTGRERLVWDLNPGLSDQYALGKVKMLDWSDDDGRVWHGRLYYPVNYVAGRKYPLVLQTHGIAPKSQFSIYGVGSSSTFPGLGPSGVSIFVAQALANHGIAVLQVEDKSGPFDLTPKEPVLYVHGYEAGVAALAGIGLVDPKRVGLSGFSRTGWYVEYALTHSDFPYAAAFVSDNYNASYVSASLFGAAGGLLGEFAQDNGAPGIGAGLTLWLRNAPGFNLDRVHTPLRMQLESGGLGGIAFSWEIFNSLRLLNKPVEFYVVPDIEHGSHNPQNPRQLMASGEGVVDWFDFWLNGHEDSSSSKVAQYERWRHLRSLRDSDQATLRDLSRQ